MRTYRDQHGDVIMETFFEDFRQQWRKTPREKRAILQDKRPAVIQMRQDGFDPIVFLTMPQFIWEQVKRQTSAKMGFEINPVARVRLCELCGSEMKTSLERESYWIFACPRCQVTDVDGKQFVGGTQGAGVKEKT